MAKFLRKEDVKALNYLVEGYIAFLDDRGLSSTPAAQELIDAYGDISEEGNTVSVIADCVTAAAKLDASWAGALNAIVSSGIRQLNYPSSWRVATTRSAQDYITRNPGTPIAVSGGPTVATWVCPGLGVPSHPAHDALPINCTVDHDTPVVWHWNNFGYDTTKIERTEWYHDASNHVIMCGSCNSAKSGGGVFYNIVTGNNYSN